jgi:hypothetical protein
MAEAADRESHNDHVACSRETPMQSEGAMFRINGVPQNSILLICEQSQIH